VGSVGAVLAVRRVAPLRLSGLAMLAFTVPLWVLPFIPPWPVVFMALFVATLFTPLINGPLIAVLTARTPGELRAMVMTAVISVNTLAAPLGFLAAGQVLERWGVVPLFATVVAGITVMAMIYSALVLRHRDMELPVPEANTA
jgi:predicted MFS family arabinose efflux permease